MLMFDVLVITTIYTSERFSSRTARERNIVHVKLTRKVPSHHLSMHSGMQLALHNYPNSLNNFEVNSAVNHFRDSIRGMDSNNPR